MSALGVILIEQDVFLLWHYGLWQNCYGNNESL